MDMVLENYLNSRSGSQTIKDFCTMMAVSNPKVNPETFLKPKEVSLPRMATETALPKHKSFAKVIAEGEIALFGRQNRSIGKILKSEFTSRPHFGPETSQPFGQDLLQRRPARSLGLRQVAREGFNLDSQQT